MQKIPVVKDGDAILGVDVSRIPNVARVVCDGKFHHVYEHGDKIPDEHQHETMTARNAAPKKTKAQKKPM